MYMALRWLGTEVILLLPFISDLMRWLGFGPATKEYMTFKMKHGKNLALLPGGFEEATLYGKHKYRIYIKDRAGFIKYSLQYGYTLHPCFSFGEEDVC